MSFAIIQNARVGKRLGIAFLGLVDRAKTKRLWWTSDDPSLLMRFDHKGAAVNAAKRLRRNNAQAVPYSHAVRVLREQSANIDHEIAMDAMEEGWDGHKHG